MNNTVIAIAVSLAIGAAAGAGATAIAFSFATTTASPETVIAAASPSCPPPASLPAKGADFLHSKPLPTTGYKSYGAKDFP